MTKKDEPEATVLGTGAAGDVKEPAAGAPAVQVPVELVAQDVNAKATPEKKDDK